jgi:hypothetical protein
MWLYINILEVLPPAPCHPAIPCICLAAYRQVASNRHCVKHPAGDGGAQIPQSLTVGSLPVPLCLPRCALELLGRFPEVSRLLQQPSEAWTPRPARWIRPLDEDQGFMWER